MGRRPSRVAALIAGVTGTRWSAGRRRAGSHGVARSHAAAGGGVMMNQMMMVGAVMNNMMMDHMMADASAPGRAHAVAGRCAHRAAGGSHAAVRARRAAGGIDRR